MNKVRQLSENYQTIFMVMLFAIFLISCQKGRSSRIAQVERIGSEPHSFVLSWKTAEVFPSENLFQRFDNEFGLTFQLSIREHLFTTSHSDGLYEYVLYVESAADRTDLTPLIAQLDADARTGFAAAIFQYQGQGLESTDSVAGQAADRFAHLETIGAADAWPISRGDKSIIIAVTDDGFDFEHQDLTEVFSLNQGELGLDEGGLARKSNGIDDDRNGYIDDFRGWDFTKGGDNDPSPESGLFFGLDSHGTHIAGIIAAQHNEKNGVAGIAPQTRIMALRFSGSGTWTSINIARSYAYAIAQGARIINTSYAIDQYADDPVYLAAIRHAYAQDVLIFNSAGNQGQSNPTRQTFEEILLVANTFAGPDSRDRLNPNSNYGTGIDFTAPGDIYSTIPGNQFQYKVGTSMATPVVAAVAALIWSVNPDWNRDQVAAHLAGTSDSIDRLNQGYEGMLGFGRVHAGAALNTAMIKPPRLHLVKQRVAITEGKITLRCLSILNGDSLKSAQFLLHDNIGRTYPLALLTHYRIGTNEIELGFPKELPPGSYELYVSDDITDPFGQALDGNLDGQAGNPLRVDLEIIRSHQSSPYIDSINLSQELIQAGETLEIELLMRDEQRHLNQAQLTFVKADGSVSISVSDAGLEAKERFIFQLDIPHDQDNGRYHLSQIELTSQDGSKSSFFISSAHQPAGLPASPISASFEIFGGQDRDRVGPRLIAFEMPQLAGMNTTVPMTITAVDEASGIARIEVLLRSAETFQTLRVEKKNILDSRAQQYQIDLVLPHLERRQEFYVAAVILTDHSGNMSRFQASDRSQTLTDTNIRVPRIYLVEDMNSDINPPRLIDVQLITPAAFRGDKARVLIQAIDDESEVSEIRVFFRKDLVVMTSYANFQKFDADRYEITVPISQDDDTGSYRLYKIELEDGIGNKVAYQSLNLSEETYPGTEIPVLYLEVQARTPIDMDGPQIHSVSIEADQLGQQLLIDITADDASGIDYMDLSMVGLNNDNIALWSDSSLKVMGAKRYQLAIRLDKSSRSGLYYINYLLAVDVLGNMTSLRADPSQQYFPQTLLQVPRFELQSSMLSLE